MACAPLAVGDVGGRQIDHEKAAVSVDGDVPLSPDDLFGGVVTPCLRVRSLDRPTIDDSRRRAGLAPVALAVEHEFDVVYRLNQKAARQLAKPPVDRTPVAEMNGKHSPTAARAHEKPGGVHHLAELDFPRTASVPGIGHQRREPLPLFIRQIRRVTLRLPGDLGYSPALLGCPHPKLESQLQETGNPSLTEFPNGLLGISATASRWRYQEPPRHPSPRPASDS